MPSSTSSSERLALRTAVAGIGILLGGLLIIRGCTTAVQTLVPDPFGIVRIKTAYQALESIALGERPKAIFFGSSTVEIGFAPDVFDEHLAAAGVPMTSYNLGIGNMNPTLQLVLAHRLRQVFEEHGARVDLMLIEFNPFQATRKRVQANAPLHEAILALFSTPRTLWRAAREDPERAIRLFTIKYLRDGVAAQAITTGLGFGVEAAAGVFETGEQGRSPEFQQVLEERQAIAWDLLRRARQEFPEWQPPLAWHHDTRGAPLRFAALSPETQGLVARLMDNLSHPETLKGDLERRIRCCDIVDLEFHDDFVRDFISLANELAVISDRIEIVLMPKNYDWVKNPPEALVRQRRVLERIEAEAGIQVADFQYLPELDGRQFFDATHLTFHEGGPRFSKLLAEYWAPRLRAR